jgi:hypothetical protein
MKADVSEEHTTSIFMVEDLARRETSMKQAANRALSLKIELFIATAVRISGAARYDKPIPSLYNKSRHKCINIF